MVGQELIPLELIDPNPWQTRQTEDPAHVEEVARSIRSSWMWQVPSGRRVGERWQIAFGHTRLAAYRMLKTLGFEGYDHFPLNVHEMNDEMMAISAFEENEKRRDLNPIEKALAFQKMLTDFNWTQQQVADKLHIDRSGVTNMLRMLRTPQEIQDQIAAGVIPVRSALALIPLLEITILEKERLMREFGDDFHEFMLIATNGEINSDAIRTGVEKFITFLRPVQLELVPEEQVMVASDLITIPEEQNPAEPNDEQEDLEDVEEQHEKEEGEEHHEQEEAEPLSIWQTTIDQAPAEPPVTQPEVVTAQPAATEPAQATPATPATQTTQTPEPEPVAVDATIFNITWQPTGVIIGLRRPGKNPVMRFREHLTINEIPALMRDMGME